MYFTWNSLNSVDALTEIKISSVDKPQLLFKHSTNCSISSIIKMRLECVSKEVATSIGFNYLDLLAHRTLSNLIADEFSVQHESPQVIIIWKREVTYDESHLDISELEIAHHLDFLFKT